MALISEFRCNEMKVFVQLAVVLWALVSLEEATANWVQPLSKIAIEKAVISLDKNAYVKASPSVLGVNGNNQDWITVEYKSSNPSVEDWIGVFSPANFSSSTCPKENSRVKPPYLCTAPIKYQFANFSNPNYKDTGKGSLKLQLINQRSNFSFGLFSGGVSNPKLLAVSNVIAFVNPNAPLYPRLAQGKEWNEMTITWTSGYAIEGAQPFVQWGPKGGPRFRALAVTLTFDRSSMCGSPARTVGWRDPGFIHTAFLKDLWPNSMYTYKLGHFMLDGTNTITWSDLYEFKASPYPVRTLCNESSFLAIWERLQLLSESTFYCDEADGSNEYNNFQHGSLNTTRQLVGDLENYDIVFVPAETMFFVPAENRAKFCYVFNGDICYARISLSSAMLGYLSQWDQFTAQVEPIASRVPYMIASGNHERDWPGSGSFYENIDSGGECGVAAETMFFVPAENRAKFCYVFNGDICYARISLSSAMLGYLSQWDQFTAQVEPIASRVPYMIASGNHERDWPGSGSFYENIDSGGECGVAAETMFFVPAENRAKFCYVELTSDISTFTEVFNGDICYARISLSSAMLGYLSQWDQFTAQVEPIASRVPYMIASGNHERDWPGSGSFYENIDSGGECGVAAETMFFVPAENRAKFWYVELTSDISTFTEVFNGDICYARISLSSAMLGYLSQWDQFTTQVEPIASRVPYMIASGNHERDWPGSGSFYENIDSGGECGVAAETMFFVPAENRAKFWYVELTSDISTFTEVFNGDICYARISLSSAMLGYLSQWDQFTTQVEPIASRVPYMIASGNHERDWPGSGSFYENIDSGGECGVAAETMFFVPAENRAKFWYVELTSDISTFTEVFNGDICYARISLSSAMLGYLSQWDQFTTQVEPIASRVPYMIASGNHERDWPGSGSFYENIDSGGECGVAAETMFFVPAENRAKFWYSTDYGMFRFCIADSEHDWREGTEQYKFIEHCMASADRQKQPWLIFLAHRVLGYSSDASYAIEGSFGEPMGRDDLQKLWQKYKVDIAVYGHVHNYERTCPIYQTICTSKEKNYYKGGLNGTIHVAAGGEGASLSPFSPLQPNWSLFRDLDYGFVKLTAFDHSNLLFEYKRSRDGEVYDSFKISRDYRDILACTIDSCPSTTLAS
ncbi:hypothetical protein SASPL_107840 [Salvia splendens]|uniref:Purple acid phosphatase n=1 Tax=Salvia splendens TaxID=180675 RepID=A0A8X8YFM3_SALSN|nr:hypothetical protein SASPL_107840 [Salvia splendens]